MYEIHHSKTPLRYPGGKSKAVKHIIPHIPKTIKRLCSPFFGGGSIELACSALGIEVFGYDVFSPLVDFWNELLERPEKLADKVQSYFPLPKEKFYYLQQTFSKINTRQERAVVFYVLNRSSFSGTTLSGGMSPEHKRFTQTSIDRLRNFKVKNLQVKQGDFQDVLQKHKVDFLYLDPPYCNRQDIYGNKGSAHKNFNHETLAGILTQRNNWILSYNDCDVIRRLYKNFRFKSLRWNYGMNRSKKSNEVLIFG